MSEFIFEDSLKSYRDLKNSLDTAFAEGIEKGIEKVAINGIRQGKRGVRHFCDSQLG